MLSNLIGVLSLEILGVMVVVPTVTPSSSSQGNVAEVAGTRHQSAGNASDFFVSSLACVLTHLVSLRGEGSHVADCGAEPLTVFHAVRVPSVSIHDYLFRIARYFLCSSECFVISLVYIDRIMKKHSEFVICKLNIHRLILTSVMLSVKFFDDVYYSNAYYAKVGGVKGSEMNLLEMHFLKLIDWQLFVSPEEFELYKTNVLVAVSGTPTASDPASTQQIENERRPSIQRTRTEYDDEGYGVDDEHQSKLIVTATE